MNGFSKVVCSRYHNAKSKTRNLTAGKRKKKKRGQIGAEEMKTCFLGHVFLYGEQCNTILKSVVVSFPTASDLVKCLKLSEKGYRSIPPKVEGTK